jgi:hypothetical protein
MFSMMTTAGEEADLLPLVAGDLLIGQQKHVFFLKRIATRVFGGFFGLVWLRDLAIALMNFSKASSILY